VGFESDYSVFGLRVRSAIRLPELFSAEGTGEPDIRIDTGTVRNGEHIEPGLNALDESLVLVVPDIARYEIKDGCAITVQPEPNVPQRNVRLFLLGSAFGALLHQRGLLPLHANAVEIDGKAVAFMGASGAGKSTLAAWFHRHGYRIIADDVCVVRFEEKNGARVVPGLPRLRLWSEAFEVLGRSPEGLSRSYAGAEEHDKFDLPVAQEAAGLHPTPLVAAYVLGQAAQFSIAPLTGLEAADAVFANTYRGSYIGTANSPVNHWTNSVRLVRTTPIFTASRIWGLSRLGEQSQLLLDHAADLIARHKSDGSSDDDRR
jgi:hypothetical protein